MPLRLLAYCNQARPVVGDLLAIAFGVLVPLGFAPFELRLTPFIALAALLLLLHELAPGRAALRGLLFGLGMFGLGVSWVFNSLYDFGSASLAVAAALAAGMVIINAVFIAGLAYALRRWFVSTAAVYCLAAFPALWLAVEWLRSWVLTGFPWLFIGYSQVDTWLGAYAPIGGVFLVSLLSVLLAAAVAGLLLDTARRPALIAIAAVLIAGFGLSFMSWTEPAGPPLQVALIQGAVPQEDRMDAEQLPLSERRYADMTEPYLDRDLIIWPETAVPTFAHWAEPFLAYLEIRLATTQAQLLTGIFVRDSGQRYYNSLLKLGDAERQVYYKRRLVPFGEYMPFRGLLEFMRQYVDIPMSDIAIGKSVPIMTLAGYPVALGVCYESAYPEIYRQQLPAAAYMVNVSNDAWFGDSFAPHQHLEIARIRALEAGRFMLRATNSGISAVIDAKGEVLAQTRQFQPDVLAAEFVPQRGATPYVRLGSWPVLLIGAGLLCLAALRARKRPDTIPR